MLAFTENIKITINLLNILTDQPQVTIDLAKKCNIGKFTLDKIIVILKSKQVIKCKKGQKGGISINRNDLSLYDVFKVFYPDPLNENTFDGVIYQKYIQLMKEIPVLIDGIPVKNKNIDLNQHQVFPQATVSPPNCSEPLLSDVATNENQSDIPTKQKGHIKHKNESLDGSEGW